LNIFIRDTKLPTSANGWYGHHPLPVIENGDAKILWDFGLITDNLVASNRPDITIEKGE